MVQLSHLMWKSIACDTILAAYVYAEFAVKYGNMYRKGSEKSKLAWAGIYSAI